jgi:hypothetical protein
MQRVSQLLLAFAALSATRAAALSIELPGASSNALIGDTGAVLSTPAGAAVNPANAAYVDRTQVEMNSSVYDSDTLYARYPGQKTYEKADGGARAPIGPPGFVYKVNPRIGISGYVLPPGISTSSIGDIVIKKIPIYVLNSFQYADVKVQGQEDGVFKLNVGLRLTRNIGVGVDISYGAASASGQVYASGTQQLLAEVKGSGSATGLKFGLRLDIVPGKFAVGAAATVYQRLSYSAQITSPLMPDKDIPLANQSSSFNNPLAGFVAGAQAVIAKARLLADVEYEKAVVGGPQFSLVDFKQKTLDVHSTLSLKLGAMFNLIDNGNALLGFEYLPASVGQGTKGPEGLKGFDSQDLILLGAGFGELLPKKIYSAGGQFGFLPKGEKHGKEVTYYYALSVSVGLSYAVASLGVDENGEQPAAYYQKTVSIPVGFIYRF